MQIYERLNLRNTVQAKRSAVAGGALYQRLGEARHRDVLVKNQSFVMFERFFLWRITFMWKKNCIFAF